MDLIKYIAVYLLNVTLVKIGWHRGCYVRSRPNHCNWYFDKLGICGTCSHQRLEIPVTWLLSQILWNSLSVQKLRRVTHMVRNYYFIISHFNFQSLRLKLIEADTVDSCTSLSWFKDFKMCVYILNLIWNILCLGVTLRDRTQRNLLGDSTA